MNVRTPLVAFAITMATLTAGCDTGVGSQTENATDIESRELGEFELYRSSKDDQFYFRLIAENGEKLLRSEGYVAIDSARAGVQSVVANGAQTSGYRVAEGANGGFFFNVVATNGQTVATSEIYETKSGAERGVHLVVGYIKATTLLMDDWTDQCGMEIYTDAKGEYRFRLRAANGEKLLASQAYESEGGVKKAVDGAIGNAQADASYDIREAANGEWYFNVVADNNEIVATSGETFSTETGCRDSAELVKVFARSKAECRVDGMVSGS